MFFSIHFPRKIRETSAGDGKPRFEAKVLAQRLTTSIATRRWVRRVRWVPPFLGILNHQWVDMAGHGWMGLVKVQLQ